MGLDQTENGWRCRECGRLHGDLFTCFGPDEPYAWHRATRVARLRGKLGKSACRIAVDGETHYYLRCHLLIPLHGYQPASSFAWNVWVEISRSDFDAAHDTWRDPARVDSPAIKGLLDTSLPYDPPTRGLPAQVHQRPVGEVPSVTVVDSAGHPLQAEQDRGRDGHWLAELNARLLARPELA